MNKPITGSNSVLWDDSKENPKGKEKINRGEHPLLGKNNGWRVQKVVVDQRHLSVPRGDTMSLEPTGGLPSGNDKFRHVPFQQLNRQARSKALLLREERDIGLLRSLVDMRVLLSY